MITLKVNEKTYRLDIDPDTPLLWAIRDHLGLTGTKYSCGIAECGACTVHVNGDPVLSCTEPVSEVAGKEVTTIEGLKGAVADALRRAWIEGDVPQCGYCQPGQIMTAASLLLANPRPGVQDIASTMSGVLCRCGTYQDIRNAILGAAEGVSP